MTRDSRRLAYLAVIHHQCPGCKSDIDFNHCTFYNQEDNRYKARYECTECQSDFTISVTLGEEKVTTEIQNGKQTEVHSETPFKTLYQRGHSAKEIADSIKEIRDILQTLFHNFDRLQQREDQLPRWFKNISGSSLSELENENPTTDLIIDVGETSIRGHLHTEVHNYLSSAYTFDQILESQRENYQWSSDLSDRFQQYKTQSRVLMGLRHFIQHEGVPPLKFRLNKTASNRETDILTDLAHVSEMPSQIAVSQPDGYQKGADFHYGAVQGEDINISQQVADHAQFSHSLGSQIADKLFESNEEDFEAFDSLGNGFFKFSKFDFSDQPDEWDDDK